MALTDKMLEAGNLEKLAKVKVDLSSNDGSVGMFDASYIL